MQGEESGFGAGGKGFLFVGFTGDLEATEFRSFALAAAGEAVFLKLQVAQLLFIAAAGFKGESGLILGFGPKNRALIDDGGAADGDDGEFEDRNSGETPANVSNRLDKSAFFAAYGLKLTEVIDAVIRVSLGFG
jgi:hypothetical protein